ncbi:alpha/beta fold hydrolase [Kitasatospora phosalacinea]|uniref:alpha/beta fold hydrolase n=1 Tax=Kitasatospora phosalacinea TaxID=2065 RepID=UPI00365D2385
MRRIATRPGRPNWLLVPGGPGLGSESLLGLARTAELPGSVWLVDLPGDGSHRSAGPPDERWPGALAEAAEAVDHPAAVGHSTGGMLLLSVPALAGRLTALALVSSAPHAGWRDTFARWAAAHPLPGLDAAAEQYDRHPDDTTLRALTRAAAPWNFTPAALPAGRRLLAGLPYNQQAVAWADTHFDATYRARWAPGPDGPPTLVLGGAEDHVVDQGLWREAPGFHGPRTLHRTVPGAGHFPWVDNPAPVRTAFAELAALLP